MIIGESVDSALGALGGKPESESDTSDSIGGIAASIAIGDNRSERGNPGAAPGDPRTPEAQRMGLLRKPESFSSVDPQFILLSSCASRQRPARVQLHPGGHCDWHQTSSRARHGSFSNYRKIAGIGCSFFPS